ncbi:hypothetical protein Hanom_Chr09g00865511 [Helianthus anomalus]
MCTPTYSVCVYVYIYIYTHFRFAPCGLVTLTVLPQTFKKSHFLPIVDMVFPFWSPPLTSSKLSVFSFCSP